MATKSATQKRKFAASEAVPTKKPKTSKPDKTAAKSKPKKLTRTAKPEKILLEASDSDDDDAARDQTAALLKGFESESSNSEDDLDADGDGDGDGTAKPLDLALLPDPTTTLSKQKQHDAAEPTGPTVLCISRVPHGFHEAQMTGYFSQFGTVTHLRLARNRRTGHSKHFAFVQFEDADVAGIVARTMNNYLLFGHILKCRLVPWEEVTRMGGVETLFKGSGRRWKKIPWNSIEKNRIQKADREGWKKRIGGEEKRRRVKMAKMKELGYEFEAPAVRAVDDVPVRTFEQEAEKQAVDATAAIELPSDAQAAVQEVPASEPGSIVVTVAAKVSSKKGTKKKKSQS